MFTDKLKSGTSQRINRLRADQRGNFGIIIALLIPFLILVVGGVIDVVQAMGQKTVYQDELDAAVLAAVHESEAAEQAEKARSHIRDMAYSTMSEQEFLEAGMSLALVANSDGSLTANLQMPHPTAFLKIVHLMSIPISVTSTAILSEATPTGDAGCIYALANMNQAVLFNSDAKLDAKLCQVHVHSTRSPAFVMNSGSMIETAKFCVKGSTFIKNGGTLTNLEMECAVADDPYADQIAEPNVPSICATQGSLSGNTISLNPGVHCNTTFNGSPTVTFKPGLHIIKGRMILNAGSTIIAKGVTFYYPDVTSEIRANGALKLTASAPISGAHAGVLMFEKTSDAANNANKQPYIFNGSLGEELTGIIHLPNRDVTYNSTTNQANQVSLVVNSIIINSADWKLSPYDGPGAASSSGEGVARLVR